MSDRFIQMLSIFINRYLNCVSQFHFLILQDSKDPATALREQIKTLSISLTTLTQEKNRLEANFIADKKQLRVR